MHYHRILVSALFVDMSSLLTSFISKKYPVVISNDQPKYEEKNQIIGYLWLKGI